MQESPIAVQTHSTCGSLACWWVNPISSSNLYVWNQWWVLTFLCSQCFPPKCREDAISPVVCSHIQSAKHLRRCDGFGVHAHLFVRLTALLKREDNVDRDITRFIKIKIWTRKQQFVHLHHLNRKNTHSLFCTQAHTGLRSVSWTWTQRQAKSLTCHSSHQHVYTCCLPCTTWPKGHHAMADPLSLKQLDYLQLPGRMTNKTCILHLRKHNVSLQMCSSDFYHNVYVCCIDKITCT